MKNNESKQVLQQLFSLADIHINENRSCDIQVYNERLYQRVLAEGSLGLGESYMDGWWDCEKLDDFFTRILKANLGRKVISWKAFLEVLKSKLLNMQSRSKSKKVAQIHYDLGNEFYSKMLGKTVQYTCAYWKNSTSLDAAQENKLELVCKKLMLKKGERVLELGCGWGYFAKYAAEKYGCEVTAYNISQKQVQYAKELCKGLPVEIIKKDYRDAKGRFDKVVSIGLCEHVGYKNYRTFMKVAHRCLNDNGLFLLHTIGGNTSITSIDPWIGKYIFPGAMLPSIKQLGEAMEGLFVIEDWHNFGADYDKTLMAWFYNFNKNWPLFKAQYGKRFYRMWTYYLLSCAGAFRARNIQLWQMVLSKGGVPGGYKSIR